MSRYHSYINTSVKLIESFKGDEPFAIFIKKIFSKGKKYGSNDRRHISALCYNYFRLGFAMKNSSVKQKIMIATFLCEKEPSDFWDKINPEWNGKINWPINEKLLLVKDEFLITEIFPSNLALSASIDIKTYCLSMLEQPALFLRIRPQCRITTIKKLEKSKLQYQLINDTTIQLRPTTNAADFFIIDKEVVVQDYSSQQVLNYLQLNEVALFGNEVQQPTLSAWDCCAASGGKSILLNDIVKRALELTISDIRLGIVMNLHLRFKKANIKQYKYFIDDIGDTSFTPPTSSYQLIICDAPCTGSGTWGRTPEQLCFFNSAVIKEFSDKQKKIVYNIMPHLRDGGIFVYITCSVFKEENEAIASFINTTFNTELLHQEVLKGYDKKADTMFVAIFKKPLV